MTDDRAIRLWVEYYKEAAADPERWKIADRVQKDFKGCTDMPLQEWVQQRAANGQLNYQYLFMEPEHTVKPVEVDEGQGAVSHRQLRLLIDMTAPDKVIAEHVAAYVNAYRIAHMWEQPTGRRKFEKGEALYALATRPDHNALEVTLYAYQQIRKHPERALWELGYAMIESHGIAPRWKHEADGADKRTDLSNLMSRLKARAERLLAGVCVGVFPAA